MSIDIQTRSGCNARCVFCGVGREKNKINGYMSDDLYKKIIDEIMTYPNLKQINPYLLNDPLVDPKIPERIEYIINKRGRSKKPIVRIITNAGLLTEDMAYKLLHSGLDECNISFNTIQKDIYEQTVPPLKYDNVMSNILKLVELRDKLKTVKPPKISVWTVRTTYVEKNLNNEKAYWKKIGVGFKARKIDNRALDGVEGLALSDRDFQTVDICPVPFWRAWIMWNGDMIMCCVDQERTFLLGNCERDSVRDIWNGPRYRGLREAWRKKKLGGFLCNTCKGT